MGHTTDYLGYLEISPPLNDAEVQYLEVFGRMRHFTRDGSPYDVPGNPAAPDNVGVDSDAYHSVHPGKPSQDCGWTPCGTGCCLSHDGIEKFNNPEPWLTYLIDHLLKPGAVASTLGHPLLEAFTFDHVLGGVVVGCRRDVRELFALVVDDNQVHREVLHSGDPVWEGAAPLAYELARDRTWGARSQRYRDSPAARARGGIAPVVTLTRGQRRSST